MSETSDASFGDISAPLQDAVNSATVEVHFTPNPHPQALPGALPAHRRRLEPPRIRAGDAYAAGDDLNRLLSAANAALYGICHAVIVGIGASPGLGFVHTGSAISFVLDVADLYKADYTIPLAFDLAAKGLTEERDARIGLRDHIAQTRLLDRIVTDIKTLLASQGSDLPDDDLNQLWDDQLGTVAGGINWADESDLAINLGLDLVQPTMGEDHIAIIGPEFDTPGSTP